jgi:hypothetical protein
MKRQALSASRRQFLQAGVALGGAGALAVTGNAQASASLLAASKASVVLHDPRLTLDAQIASSLKSAGAVFVALTEDPVRQWRGDQAWLLAQHDTRLFGVTRWPDFLIVRGLAAESRRLVRHESLDPASGVMTWLIA